MEVKMKTVYQKDKYGNKITFEVSDEIAEGLSKTRRAIWRNDSMERYHCTLSLNAMIDYDERTSYVESPEEIYIAEIKRRENQQKLLVALKSLTKQQMELVRLKFVENKSLQEIASYYGITYQTVQYRIKKVLEKLKKFF